MLTSNKELAERLRKLRAHWFDDEQHFMHSQMAYGGRMTDMQGAVGLTQHRRRNELLEQRQQIASWYTEILGRSNRFTLPMRTRGAAWWVFPLIARTHTDMLEARKALADAGVETRSYFMPMHLQPWLTQYADREFPVAEDLYRRGFYLPLYPGMEPADVEYICNVLN